MTFDPSKLVVGVLPEEAQDWEDQLCWGMIEQISLTWNATQEQWTLLLTRASAYPWDDARRNGRTKVVLGLVDGPALALPHSTFTYLDACTLKISANHLVHLSF